MRAKIAIMIFLVMAKASLATSVYTEYSGSGDLSMTSTVTSPVAPEIENTVSARTSEDGSYDGTMYHANDQTSLSVNNVTVSGGCALVSQKIVEQQTNGRTAATQYSAGAYDGRVQSWVSAVPLKHYNIQSAAGSESWAIFSQNASGIPEEYSVYLIGVSDGGGLTMVNRMSMRSWPTLYNASLSISSSSLAYLEGMSTSCIGINASMLSDDAVWILDSVVSGNGEVEMSTLSDGPIILDANMVIG